MGESDDFDPIIYAPSMLCEGKALGTAKQKDLQLVQNLIKASSFYPYPAAEGDAAILSKEIKAGQAVGKRKLKEVQARTKDALLRLIAQFRKDTIGESELRKGAVKAMKTAWRDVFLAGVRAGGIPGQGAGKGKLLVSLTTGVDDVWLKTAMAHEMRFLNGFLDAIVEDNFTMPLDRRAQMYVTALDSFYESARLIALPDATIIHWVGPGDKRTCPSCRYLFEHSPYTKGNIPCTPRNGLTLCITACRDHLLVRRVEPGQAQKVLEEAEYTRGGHIANLRKIKRQGHL